MLFAACFRFRLLWCTLHQDDRPFRLCLGGGGGAARGSGDRRCRRRRLCFDLGRRRIPARTFKYLGHAHFALQHLARPRLCATHVGFLFEGGGERARA
jgi:hypothetical protein